MRARADGAVDLARLPSISLLYGRECLEGRITGAGSWRYDRDLRDGPDPRAVGPSRLRCRGPTAAFLQLMPLVVGEDTDRPPDTRGPPSPVILRSASPSQRKSRRRPLDVTSRPHTNEATNFSPRMERILSRC